MSDTVSGSTNGNTDILTLEAASPESFPNLRIVAVLTDANGVPVPGSDPLGAKVADIVSEAATAAAALVPGYNPPYMISPNVGLVVTPIADLRTFQRSTMTGGLYGKGIGNVAVQVTLSAPALSMDYRLRDALAPGNPVLQDWTPAAYGVPAGKTILILGGVPARLGWYYVDLRPNLDNTQIVLGTTRVGMGRLIGFSGQSLAVRMIARMDGQTATLASLGVEASPFGSVYATYVDSQRTDLAPAWAIPADGTSYDSTEAAEQLRLEIGAAGVNCSLIGHAVGQQSITTFIPGGANNAQLLATLQGAGGMWEEFVWNQGHADAGALMPNLTYQGYLTTLFNWLDGINNYDDAARIIMSIPNIEALTYGTTGVEVIRQAATQWAAANGAFIVLPMDLDLVDGIHPTQLGAISEARAIYRASRSALGLGGVGDTGPSIISASRTAGSGVIRLGVQQAGGTALSLIGNPGARIPVFNRGVQTSPAPYTVASLFIASSSEIDITLSPVPADSQPLDIWPFFPPDPSIHGQTDMIYDNNANDGDGLTLGRSLMPALTPILADALVPTLTINTPATMSPGSTVTITGSYYGPPPTGLNWKINGGAYAAAVNPVISGNTWSFQITAPASFSATNTITVQEANATGVTVTSGNFIVGNVGPTATLSANAAFGPGKFGQALTAGYGYVPTQVPANGYGTYECWVSLASASGTQIVLGQNGAFYLEVTSAGLPLLAYGASTPTVKLQGPTSIADAVKHHLALVVTPTGGTAYVDGVSIGSSTTTPAAAGLVTNAGPTVIGAFTNTGASGITTASVDEVAIFNYAKYTGNFTPPTAPYVGTEAGLVICFHLDGDGTSIT